MYEGRSPPGPADAVDQEIRRAEGFLGCRQGFPDSCFDSGVRLDAYEFLLAAGDEAGETLERLVDGALAVAPQGDLGPRLEQGLRECARDDSRPPSDDRPGAGEIKHPFHVAHGSSSALQVLVRPDGEVVAGGGVRGFIPHPMSLRAAIIPQTGVQENGIPSQSQPITPDRSLYPARMGEGS